jgi:hypothetical protein
MEFHTSDVALRIDVGDKCRSATIGFDVVDGSGTQNRQTYGRERQLRL